MMAPIHIPGVENLSLMCVVLWRISSSSEDLVVERVPSSWDICGATVYTVCSSSKCVRIFSSLLSLILAYLTLRRLRGTIRS